ncbi:splicing factor 45-like [Bolinopsis microptera]|uniref:splicing factor 45-like n=1 Tax=Bolinopsis microptera TaxID=2820187 RepID=UPI00307ACF8B
MSLYGGIDVEIAKSETNLGKANFNFMNAQLMRKALPKLTKSSASAAAIKEVVKETSSATTIHPDEIFVETDASKKEIAQEYDPVKPNDYSVVNALIQKRKREKKYEEENKRAKPLVSAYDDTDKLGIEDDMDFYEDPNVKKKEARAPGGGFSGDKDNDYDGPSTTAKVDWLVVYQFMYMCYGAWIDPKKLLQETHNENAGVTVNRVMSMKNVSSIASNIMSKYGWKEGQGLGKEEQGMASALQVEKTGRQRGVIVNESEERAKARIEVSKQEEERKAKAAEVKKSLKQPSKVILLKNMVGPGEVDDDLEGETREECSKYGEVIQVVIYEIPSGVAVEEAVRIFVQFNRVESAVKAVVDLHNRFFGGRTVKCTFYPVEKFEALDLAPQADEL